MELEYFGFRIEKLLDVTSDLYRLSSLVCLLPFNPRLAVSPSLRVVPLCLVLRS
jgi:hypothetical protein